MKYIQVVSIAFFLISGICLNLIAQDRPQMRGPASERIEQFKKVRLMEVLKMDEETSIRFFARYDKYAETLHAIQKDHNTLIDQLHKLTKSNANNSDIEQALKDIGMSEEKIAETRSKFLEELKGVISIKQVAEYVVFERDFNKNLREIMRDIAKERWNRQK
jgi:translation initiation factor 2 beta subunit (eIF-2beta)/eIF-5